jgi:hypothetical protein
MPAFDGRRNIIGWTVQSLGSGWTGTIHAARDGRTVSINLGVLKASWSDDGTIGTVDGEFAPSFARYHPVSINSSGATAWVVVYPNGVVATTAAGSAGGLTGCITYII